jgi:small-conductance mechanosensitive channel
MAFYATLLFLVWLFEHVVRTVVLTRIRRLEYRYAAIKVFTATVYTITVLWILSALLVRHPSIITSFAIVGAGIAIALQDVVKDILGWMMIRQHRLFTQGQRVTIGTDTGEIIDIGALRTRMLEVGTEGNPVLERTGKILSLPNAAVLTQRVTNHSATSDFVRAEMHVTVTFESNWEKAEKILLAILEEQTGAFEEKDKRQYASRTKMYFVPKQSRGPAVHVDIAADGIDFTLRFSVPIGERRPIATQVAKEVLRRFSEHSDIELAYKTSRILSGPYESPTTAN